MALRDAFREQAAPDPQQQVMALARLDGADEQREAAAIQERRQGGVTRRTRGGRLVSDRHHRGAADADADLLAKRARIGFDPTSIEDDAIGMREGRCPVSAEILHIMRVEESRVEQGNDIVAERRPAEAMPSFARDERVDVVIEPGIAGGEQDIVRSQRQRR